MYNDLNKLNKMTHKLHKSRQVLTQAPYIKESSRAISLSKQDLASQVDLDQMESHAYLQAWRFPRI